MFAKFIGKVIFWSLFFNEMIGCVPVILFKNTARQMFSCNLCEICQSTYFTEHHQVNASTYQVL